MKKRPPKIRFLGLTLGGRFKKLLAGGLFMRKKTQPTLNLLRIKS